MIWFAVLLIAYIFTAVVVVKTDDKTMQLIFLGGWALLALAIGHFVWGVFG